MNLIESVLLKKVLNKTPHIFLELAKTLTYLIQLFYMKANIVYSQQLCFSLSHCMLSVTSERSICSL